MKEHLTDQEIQSYTKGQLPPEKLLAADDHLSSCEVCRNKSVGAINLHESFTNLKSQIDSVSNHLSYSQLTQWIDGTTDRASQEAIRRHLKECHLCAAEENDLRKFAQSRKDETNVRPFSQRSLSLTWLQAAAAIAVIAGAGLILFWPMQNRIEQLQSELQRSQSEIAELRKTTINQAPAILALQDGERQITIDANGNLRGLPVVTDKFADPIKRSLQTLHLQIPSIPSELRPPKGKLLGPAGESSFFPIYPYGSVVLSDKPEFTWQPLANAKSYKIAIYDRQYQKVLISDALSTPSWIPSKALARGEIFSWQVTAVLDGQEIMTPLPPAPEAKFKILEAALAEKIEEAKATAKDSHLLLGVLYAEAGLLSDAEKEFLALQSANPKSPVPITLLKQVETSP